MKLEQFGKDHWSVFAYAETCCVDNRGRLENMRLRINQSRHPVGGHPYGNPSWKPIYGTVVKGGGIPDTNHDDIDCLDDLEEAGLLEQGTMVNPLVRLTDRGKIVASQLRQHKMDGGQFATFEVGNAVALGGKG